MLIDLNKPAEDMLVDASLAACIDELIACAHRHLADGDYARAREAVYEAGDIAARLPDGLATAAVRKCATMLRVIRMWPATGVES